MIRLVVDNHGIVRSVDGVWLVFHPSNAAIFAYCDTEDEARKVWSVIHAIAADFENTYRLINHQHSVRQALEAAESALPAQLSCFYDEPDRDKALESVRAVLAKVWT